MAHTHRRVWAIVAAIVGATLVAIALVAFVLEPHDARGIYLKDAGAPSTTPVTVTTTVKPHPPTTRHRPAAPRLKPSPRPARPRPAKPAANLAPLAVRIPSVGISSPLIRLGLNSDNTLQVPTDFSLAGWYIYRSVPGEPGPSIIAGHIDSHRGPGVFYRLRDVPIGATVEVSRNDGSTAQFTVTAKEEHSKDAFPTQRVYGPTSSSELRVITCGGSFNTSTGHYRDNIIVFARLTKLVR